MNGWPDLVDERGGRLDLAGGRAFVPRPGSRESPENYSISRKRGPAVTSSTSSIVGMPARMAAPQPVRSMANGPITSTSMRVRRKQSSASAGVQTIGSFSLKDVFRTIGTPVRSPKARIRRQ